MVGLAMVGVGLAVRQLKPETLRLPEPGGKSPRLRDVRDVKGAAHKARDALAGFIPDNLFGSLGRTLMIMGGAMIAVRALDELVDDDTADY
ncbi:hypothetical protein F3S47_18200 [Histidinibacterium aquaticum]|uniref:Uncharacterized protein n=1 Tax=Histidinibacterium aquaticum TaxID=2613962 RepID=A0A5J5GB32_9RHOB|nr:hypothetical protein F3S47_18200 [Histidinibacterium aquaticum]